MGQTNSSRILTLNLLDATYTYVYTYDVNSIIVSIHVHICVHMYNDVVHEKYVLRIHVCRYAASLA